MATWMSGCPVLAPGEASSASRFARVAALIEVMLAFGIIHLLFRTIKHFTRRGRWGGAAHLNFTPGLVMILFTACVLVMCRRNPPKFPSHKDANDSR